jgi:uncharacterized protein YndB with AHSA1/START domain
METTKNKTITVETTVNAPVGKVWQFWTDPVHITKWCQASDDWHAPRAENDIRTGGKFVTRMEAKDGSFGFDFSGIYDKVEPNSLIEYTLEDNRRVQIVFTSDGNKTTIRETFDPEETNSLEMQQSGWQAILDNFRKYSESKVLTGKMHYEIHIHASAEKVCKTMIDEKHYNEWTAAFNATSRFEGSWDKGSKIVFLGTGEDGKIGGMVSRIEENIPNKFISIEHLGMINDGKEVMTGPEVDAWAGAHEDYTFSEENGGTRVSVDIDTNEEYKTYFEETWPKALQVLKRICET